MEPNGNPKNYEHSSHAGAVELARRIRAYWLDRGYAIKTRVESLETDKHSTVYVVRSDLVTGLPPKESKVLAMDEAA